MLLSLLDELRHAGVAVEHVRHEASTSEDRADAVVHVEGQSFAVEERARAPYPNELTALETRRARLAAFGIPLLVVPYVSDGLAEALRRAGWSWADDAGNFDLRAAGLVLRQRRTHGAPPPRRTTLPHGTGSLGIVRSLIRFPDHATGGASATLLAERAGVSQPRASQVLGTLREHGLVTRTPQGRWVADRPALLDRFLAEYRGPGGSERSYFSVDPLIDVACSVASMAAPSTIAVSADVGPDLISAWRRPNTLVIYARDASVRWDRSGIVAAESSVAANVIVRAPRDLSVFPQMRLAAEVRGVEVPLADPVQMIWDLHQLGGQDRLEAAGVMREWILRDDP